MSEEFESHGHSAAAWTGVGTILFGFLMSSVAVILGWVWLFCVGVVICLLGIVAGKVLSIAGYGQSKVSAERDGIG